MKPDYTEIMLTSAKIAMNSQGAQELVDGYVNLFKVFFGIEGMDFYTLDYNTGMFRDFVRDWIYIEEKEQQKAIFAIFDTFKDNRDKFIINKKNYN